MAIFFGCWFKCRLVRAISVLIANVFFLIHLLKSWVSYNTNLCGLQSCRRKTNKFQFQVQTFSHICTSVRLCTRKIVQNKPFVKWIKIKSNQLKMPCIPMTPTYKYNKFLRHWTFISLYIQFLFTKALSFPFYINS